MNSLGQDTSFTPHFPTLCENKKADVCIIGAGITGINLAYLLNANHLNVILLEKDSICNRTNRQYHWQINKSTWFILFLFNKKLWQEYWYFLSTF